MEKPKPLRLTNQLEKSSSPYVRGHRNNPVAWQLWDPAALSLAKKYNRLIFLSIGYSACHWCHVMERESFENDEIATLLNQFFIPIKVDREERPDVDRIYMDYVQATTGSGGWPLNVFITPDLEPVFGGTYFPGPHAHHTPTAAAVAAATLMGGEQVHFQDVLRKMADVWATQEDRCRLSAKEILTQLKDFAEEGTYGEAAASSTSTSKREADEEVIDIDLLEEAYEHFKTRFDKAHGGFSSPPKFATPSNLKFLLSLQAAPPAVHDIIGEQDCMNGAFVALHTLRKMARGGIHDQIGGGFHRYSVTADWSLPHFEKMLYDNAQLLSVYLDAFLLTNDPEMLGVVYNTVSYLLDSPIHTREEGVFYASEDADSAPSTAQGEEKREGAHYVMTRKELTQVLGEDDAEVAARFFNIQINGNVRKEDDLQDEFLDQNVLQIVRTPAHLATEVGMSDADLVTIIKRAKDKLRQWREDERPRPSVDDKVLACWNGLAIGALARVGAVLEVADPARSKEAGEAAVEAARFVMSEMYDKKRKVLKRVWRGEVGGTDGFVDDYAFMIQGLIELYEATFDEVYLRWADELQETQIALFHDAQKGGFFSTTPSPDLILRLKSGMDGSEPSPNGISAQNLYRLSSLLNDEQYETLAHRTIQAFEAELLQHPFLFASMMRPVVTSRLGAKSWIISGETEQGKKVLKGFRGRLSFGETVVVLPNVKTAPWLRSRNKVLREVKGDRVLLCERGRCREVKEGEFDMEGLREALPKA